MKPIKELMQHAIDKGSAEIADGKQVMPRFIAEGATGDRILVMATWPNDATKALALAGVRELFKKHGVIRYVFLAETWMATQSIHDADRRPPSQREDRQDVLCAIGVEYGATHLATCPIITEGGKRRCGGPIQWIDDDKAIGSMVSLLPDRTLS